MPYLSNYTQMMAARLGLKDVIERGMQRLRFKEKKDICYRY